MKEPTIIHLTGAQTVTFQDVESDPDVIMRVTGTISTEVVNSQQMVVLNEAITDSIADYLRFPQVLFDHNWGQVVARADSVDQVGAGWDMTASVLNTSAGRDVAVAVRTGAVRGFSMGIRLEDDDYDRQTGILTVKKATLQEVSLTGRPANPTTVARAALSALGYGEKRTEKEPRIPDPVAAMMAMAQADLE